MALSFGRFSGWASWVIPALLLLLPRAAHGESGSALTRLAQQISAVTPPTPVFAAVTPVSGVVLDAKDRAALDAKLASVLGSAVAASRGRGASALTESDARRRSRELGLALVLLRPSLAGGRVLVDLDVIEWELSFWARARKPLGTVVAHASFSEPADAEIRRYLPRPNGLLQSELRFQSPEAGAIGLACGDARGQGSSELLVVGRRNLFIGSLSPAAKGQRGAFVPRREAAWTSFSPLSPHPLRAPLATAWMGPGTVLIGSSDRAALLRLDAELAQPTFAPAAWPVTPERCHAFTATGIAEAAATCGPASSTLPKTTSPALEAPSRDALAVLAHADERGIVRIYELESAAGGRLELTIESPLEQRQQLELGVGGAQVALADLDGDSIVEAITTGATESGADTLEVRSLRPEGPVLVATRSVGPVRALAVCPFVGKNPQRLAVLLTDEIRIYE